MTRPTGHIVAKALVKFMLQLMVDTFNNLFKTLYNFSA